MAITRIKNNQITDATITNVKILSQTLTGDLMNPNLTFNSNLVLNGNLTVTGNVTAVQSTTTQITDPLLTLGLGNAGTSYDLGLVLIRGSGGNRFIGFKENEGAFVFINTTEDGLTTGNIATTAYSNVIFGNAVTLGSSTFGGITLNGNTVSAAGILTVRSDAGTVTIPNAAIISSTLSVSGTTTVDSLISNAGIIATTGSFSSNLTAANLTVNASATIGTTLGVTGNATVGNLTTSGNINAEYFLGNGSLLTDVAASSSSTAVTVTGNAQPNITSVGILSSLTSSGNITANELTINNSATVGTTLGVTGNINGSGITLTGSLVATGPGNFDGGLQNTPIGNVAPSTALFTTVGTSGNSTVAALTVNGTATVGSTLGVTGTLTGAAAQFTTINGSGTATLNALNVNNAATAGTTLTVGGTATVNALVSNGAIQGTTLNGSANATVNGLTVNTSAVVGTTLQSVAGIQNTAIGNVTAASGAFTTLDATGAITGATTINTSGTATLNALTVNNAATIGTTLVTGGTATVNALVSNGAIQGTTLNGSGNATVNALTVNTSAVVGSTLQAVAGVQATPIGNVTAASGAFTTLDATGAITGATTITTTGTATLNALTVNNAATAGTTLTVGGTATVNALVSNTTFTAASGTILGNLLVEGNLAVLGNLSYINVDTFIVEDPIIQLNTGPNGAPLSVDNNFDSGVSTNYFDTADRRTFFGRKDSSGFFEYFSNVASETGNVITGTYGTIKSGNLELVSAATVGTTMVVGGNTTVNALTVNNSATVGTTLGVAGNITAGNVGTTNITAVDGVFTNNVTIAGTLTATSNIVANSSGIFFGNSITGMNALYAGLPTYTVLPTTVAQFTTNVNSYSQINTQNLNNGEIASTDYVATADNGDDSTYFINMGITSSGHEGYHDDFFANISTFNDGYLYVVGYDSAGPSLGNVGNLLLGSTNGLVKTFVGNTDVANVVTTHSYNQFAVNVTTASTNSATGALVVAGGAGIAGAINGGSTLNVVGTATVNALVSNGAVSGTTAQFTTVNGSGNATVNGLTVNTSAVVGTTLQAAGGVQATPIGNVTASSGAFTTLDATGAITGATTITTTGTATLNALTVNNAGTVGTTLTVGGTATVNALVSNGAIQGTTLNGSGNATVAALTVNASAVVGTTLQAAAGVQATPIGNVTASTGNFTTVDATGAITGATTLTTTGTATVNALTVNNAATIGTTLVTGGTATVNALISNGSIQGTTLSGSGNATVNGLTVNASAVVGTTLQAVAGVQATPIGNATASSGAFTTLTSSGLTTFTDATDSTGPTSGAVVITGGLAVGKDLNVTTEANIGNVTINNLTITSNITDQGLNINPNGTGVTTINSGLNTSRTVINGTAANTLVVSGAQVGVNTSSFISGATFQINAVDTMLLPVGSIGDRPGSPAAGMLRFSTSQGSIEWYNGAAWAIPTGDFTVVVANSQIGDNSQTIFTLPVANASTAGTIVSINGVVQQPTSAYSISGSDVTFTEAPASTDVIDFRVFTTTTQVTEVTDIAGTTGLFLDLPAANSKITTFKTFGTESFSIQANSTARFTGNVEPSANITYSLGSTTNRWKDLWLSGSTIYLGNIQIQNTTGDTVSFVTSTGAPAALNVDISDPSGIQSTPIGNATPASGNFTTLGATGALTVNSLNGVTAIVNGGSSGTGNIGASGATFNTVFAKATTAQYADLAENYSGDAVYEPGTVVHFGGSQEVTICDEDMCRRVAGVVSTNPAYLMNSHLQGIATPVALQGRVPCKVQGRVRLGDMMVSAGNGFARAEANPTLGSVIGKALADFDGIEGVIEVVVGRV